MAECPSDVCVGGVEEWMRVITSASAVEEYSNTTTYRVALVEYSQPPLASDWEQRQRDIHSAR